MNYADNRIERLANTVARDAQPQSGIGVSTQNVPVLTLAVTAAAAAAGFTATAVAYVTGG